MMVALPDAFLYYTEQHPEWIREEYDMPSYAVKIDANHGLIKRAAQSFGVFVIDLWQCAQFVKGLPDMQWILPWTSTPAVLFIEVKDGFDKKLTPAEHTFINELRNAGALCYVLHSLDEAIKLLKGMRRGG